MRELAGRAGAGKGGAPESGASGDCSNSSRGGIISISGKRARAAAAAAVTAGGER